MNGNRPAGGHRPRRRQRLRLHPGAEGYHSQVHFRSNYETGECGWPTSLGAVKRPVDWQRKQLKPNRIDYGMIRRLDGEKGWQAYRDGGILDFPPDMKRRDAGDQRLF